MNTETFEGAGGLKIFTRSYRPEKRPRGAVVIVHGFNSHSGHYDWVSRELVNNGYAAYALDLRGRGQSEGERFFIEHASDYVSDVATFVKLVKTREPGVPVFMLAHSAGGVVAALYALDHQAQLTGLICESSAFEVPAPNIALTVLKGLSHIVPHTHVLRLANEHFSRDPRVVDAMNHDPLIAHESQPSLTIAELVRADERLRREAVRITLPLLILHGTMDKVTSPHGSKLIHEKAGSVDKTLKLYEGHFHDLLNDVDKQVVMADIISWIGQRVPSPMVSAVAH
jgi:alpha-beta hydrolase superfamily lysophospholipase